MANDSRRVSQLSITTALTANTDRVVVLTNPSTSPNVQTIAVNNFVTSIVNTFPVANTSHVGLVKVDGTTISSNSSGGLTVTPVSNLVNGGYNISLDNNGVLNLPLGIQLGANVEGEGNTGFDFYGSANLDYMAFTYGTNPANGYASYITLNKTGSDLNRDHQMQLQLWRGTANGADGGLTQWTFNANGQLTLPSGASMPQDPFGDGAGIAALQANGTGYALIMSPSVNTYILVDSSTTRISANNNYWYFNQTGVLALPSGGDIQYSNGMSAIGQINTAAQYTFTNTLTYSANVQFNANVFANAALVVNAEIVASNGVYSYSQFRNVPPYGDGIVMDYISNNGRISVGSADGITFYTGGVGTTPMFVANTTGLTVTGNVAVTNNISFSDGTYQNTAFRKVAAPATSTSTGSAGQIAYDTNYIYICVATNTWKRVALNLTSW